MSEADRFWSKVDVGHPLGCWLWTDTPNPSGYGRFRCGSRHTGDRRIERAHRYAHELLVGPIPDGMVLDHLCEVRLCVNPDHLQVTTIGGNVARSLAGRGQTQETVAARFGWATAA